MLQRSKDIKMPAPAPGKVLNVMAREPRKEPANIEETFARHVQMTRVIGACISRLASANQSVSSRGKFLASEDVLRWGAECEWLKSLNASTYSILQDLGKNAIGPVAWATQYRSLRFEAVPPIPPFVTRDLLFSRCPLKADGTLVKDSHLLVLVPSRANESPASIARLFGAAVGGKAQLGGTHASLTEALPVPKWMLIPKDPSWRTADGSLPPGYREVAAVELFLSMMVASSPEGAFPAGVTYRCASHPNEPTERLAITSLRNLKSRQSPFTLCHHTDLRIPTAITYAGEP